MDEIIKIDTRAFGKDQVQTCNARDLHKFLGVGKDFSNWVKAQIDRAGFIEGQDYVKIPEKSSSPKRASGKIQEKIDYFFTISAGKEIAMMSNTNKGKEARLYFIHCEQVAKEASALLKKDAFEKLPDFTNPVTAARAWADQMEKRQALEAEVVKNAPKVAFTDHVVASGQECTITEAAKTLGIAPRKFFDWLRAHGYIYKQQNKAMQTSIDDDLMVVRFIDIKHKDGERTTAPYAHVTGKGLFHFYKRLWKEGLINRNLELELAGVSL